MAVVYEWHDSEQAPQAQMACAKLLYETGHYERAFEEFQYLVDFYQGQFPYEEAVEYQFKIANHVRTEERGRFLFFPPRASPERALPLFVQYLKNAPRAAHADEAQFFVGAIHDIKKEYEQAVVAYETLQHRYPKSELLAEAGYLAALDHVRIARSVPRDERTTRATLAALAVFVRDYPDHRGAPEIRAEADTLKEALAGMYYERALFYDRTGGRPKAAIIAYSDFLDNFPSSSRSDAVRKRIAELESTAGGLE
jgi:outer membrane protein assembly factor BamD (BamD/ComL family)